MSLYRRLDAHLESQAETGGRVTGTLSGGRIFMIWLAANLVVTTLLTGTLFVPGIGYGQAAAAIVGGTLIGAIVLTTVGAIGTRTGLATMALTRGAFGLRGSLLPVAANVIILMGWSWVQAMLAGVTVDHLIAGYTGWSNPILWSVLCQAIVVALAIFGHTGIAKVEPWLAVLILAIMAYVFAVAFGAFSPAEYAALPADPSLGMTPISALDIVIATAISWTVLSADFNRFARSTRGGVIGAGLGYTTSTTLAMLLGLTALSYLLARGDVAAEFDPTVIVDGFGTPLALVIFFSVMATNTMVVYGMTTSVVNARPGWKLRFLPTALVIGGVSILGSTWLALLGQFTDFLAMISAFFIPVFAIMIVDYYVIKRARYGDDILRSEGGRYWYRAGVNWAAVAVWVIGAGATYAWTYVWPLPVGASLPALALSAALYWLLSLRGRAVAVPAAPR
ncbi:purine-cytosine permease family protein [Sediminivirga luteola]|uniref:Cytosine permease n=1 Tax=Sediminivirga luteola TaxID=1774748 RepID=A0A8J2XKG9_9MICO|nr:cytosine permease [Sediminivirga luteola]MCI2266001.1 cytosine permease [Sediminivirga luteola]GGA28133.1 cytosine permease [Sediminivirga luteola]